MAKAIAFILLIVFSPVFVVISLLIIITTSGPFFFKQRRFGKNKIPFTIYKFRTMILNAEKQKEKYLALNELDGPFFKITNDPRHTWVGRILIRCSLDELPQLINIVKGEMAFVGPRPFPIDEALKIPIKYDKRYSVLPGLMGTWVLEGYHNLSFDEWMKVDIEYTNKKSLLFDFNVVIKTCKVLFYK